MHLDYIRYTIAIYYLISACGFVCLLYLDSISMSVIMFGYKLHDYIIGHFIFAILAIMTILQVCYVMLRYAMLCYAMFVMIALHYYTILYYTILHYTILYIFYDIINI